MRGPAKPGERKGDLARYPRPCQRPVPSPTSPTPAGSWWRQGPGGGQPDTRASSVSGGGLCSRQAHPPTPASALLLLLLPPPALPLEICRGPMGAYPLPGLLSQGCRPAGFGNWRGQTGRDTGHRPPVLSLGWGKDLPLPSAPGPLLHAGWTAQPCSARALSFSGPMGHQHGGQPALSRHPHPCSVFSQTPTYRKSHVSVCLRPVCPPPSRTGAPRAGPGSCALESAPPKGSPGTAHTGWGSPGLSFLNSDGQDQCPCLPGQESVPGPAPTWPLPGPAGDRPGEPGLQGLGSWAGLLSAIWSLSPPIPVPPAHVWALLWAGGPMRSSLGSAWGGGGGRARPVPLWCRKGWTWGQSKGHLGRA